MVEGAIGVDIGGTKIAVGFVDNQGNILERRNIATEVGKGPDSITQQIVGEVRSLAGSQRIAGVGVGMAGQIDAKSGLVHFAPNLRWKDFPFGQKLCDSLGVSVAVTNDVRAAAWGEWVFGAGKGHNDLVCLFVGTGIGGGVVSGGKMLEGASNCAGELGHTVIDLKGPKCHCGNHGCIEALAGGWAIGRTAQELIAKDEQQGKLMLELSGGDLLNVTAKTVSKAALQNDPLAVKILDDVVKVLTAGVISVVNGLNPSCVILGGGVVEGNRSMIEKIAKGVRERALGTAVNNLSILGAALKNDAGMIGAASYVRSKTINEG